MRAELMQVLLRAGSTADYRSTCGYGNAGDDPGQQGCRLRFDNWVNYPSVVTVCIY